MTNQKTTERTYTIMEAAKLSGLPESTLRYYETIGLIKPIRRDMSSKHRAYTDDDINLVISVACLNATGMSIDAMRIYLGNRGGGAPVADEQLRLLTAQKDLLVAEAHYLKLRQRYVDQKIAYWGAVKAGNTQLANEVKLRAEVIARELKMPVENLTNEKG